MSGCEALYHHPDCPCPTCDMDSCGNCPHGVVLTKDHFTPQKIRRIWKVSPSGDDELDISNLQSINYLCHKNKDRSTPVRAIMAKRARKGKPVTQDDYRRDVLPHDLREVGTGKPIRLNPGERVKFKNK